MNAYPNKVTDASQSVMRYMNHRLIWLTALVFILSGCSSYLLKQREMYVDPSFRRVALFNDTSNFVIQETGIFNESIHPGERVETNIECFGSVEGLVDAYVIVGHDKNGSAVLEWYGQRRYRLYVDAKNETIRGMSVDAYQVFTDNYFYPNRKKEVWGASINPCSGPGVIIKFGR